ncbi:MAG: Hsp20/alpha crystallin family protein [Acidobacteria bacterium]|nr:Hsp20/alpha crystallin family protein [Acidobacteriota bacterium]
MAKLHRLLSELTAIEQQLSQMVRGPNVFSMEQPNSTWLPAVDIFETRTSFVLTAEVPGVKSSEIDIKVVDDKLILRGERRWERDVQGEHFHRLESSYGKFERSFSLSEHIDAGQISAELERGVLKVILPKRDGPAGKQIQIKTEDQGDG